MRSSALAILLCSAAFGAAAQAQKPKPQNKPTLGTVQLPGDNGKLQTTYQLGAKQSELHFTLDSANLATVFPAPQDLLVAGANERLLVLNFTVQNPLNKDQRLGSSSFAFTVVSPDDDNHPFRGYLLHGTKKTRVDQDLKPAQKVKCTVVVPIYAEGPVTKVIVQRGNAPVLRYDLSDKVGKLKSVFSPEGIDMLNTGPTIPVQGSADMGPFSVRYDGVMTTTDPVKGQAPGSGEVYFCIDVTFTNVMQQPVQIGFQYFMPELIDQNGEKFSWNGELISRGMDRSIYQDINPGEFISARYFYRMPSNRVPKVLRLTHNPTKRTVSFELP